MGGGLWQGFFLQTGAKSKVNEASQKRSLELGYKWHEFKNNEVIRGYGQFFSVSISSKVSSLEPRSPV